jgi:hypothetical protein
LNSLDIYQVLKHLPHRYPFLLIDRVLDYTKGESLTAIKNVTDQRAVLPGAFPEPSGNAGRAGGRGDGPGLRGPDVQSQETTAQRRRASSVRRHRQGAFQASGRAGRPAAIRGLDNAQDARHLDVRGHVPRSDEELACSAELMCTYKEFE